MEHPANWRETERSGAPPDFLLGLLPLDIRSRRAAAVGCAAWGAAVFTLDLATPYGIATDALYGTAMVATLWLRSRTATLAAALLATGAVLLGGYLSPAGGGSWAGAVNRSIGVAIVLLSTILVLAVHHALTRLEQAVRDRETLIREVNHRLRNNLDSVCSLLTLQAEKTQTAEARTALEQAHDRVHAMALLHQQVYRFLDTGRIRLPEYLRKLVEAFAAAHGTAVTLHLPEEPTLVEVERAIACGLIVNELLTNAMKHAFPGGAPGVMGVHLRRLADRYELRVWDTGVGLSTEADLAKPDSLGLRLVQLLVTRLHGSMTASGNGGTSVTVGFPAEPES